MTQTSDVSSAKTDGRRVPYPEPPFAGKLGRTVPESTPAYPQRVAAPDGSPNIVVIMLDDIGFGQAGVSGGPVPTPHMDSLGERSATLNRFHTTSLCSPTRAALLTGRNHHHVGFGTIVEGSTGFPGYNCAIPNTAATVAATLKLIVLSGPATGEPADCRETDDSGSRFDAGAPQALRPGRCRSSQ